MITVRMFIPLKTIVTDHRKPGWWNPTLTKLVELEEVEEVLDQPWFTNHWPSAREIPSCKRELK